jgi:hypothetical protein
MRLLIAQLECPITTDVEAFLAAAKGLTSAGGFHLYNPGGGLSPLALGSLLQEELGKEIYLHFHPADRNRAALFSDLITASALRLDKVVLGSGQHPAKTRFPQAKPVYDLDLLQLLQMTQRVRAGFDPAGGSLEGGVPLQIGVSAQADSPVELLRLKQMIELGADYVLLRWPSKLLGLSQLQEMGRPIYLSLGLEELGKEGEDWRKVKDPPIAGINLRIPAGQETKGEEVLKWCSRYLSSES